jgi:solute carrier family 30 (zinc transporter), member 1
LLPSLTAFSFWLFVSLYHSKHWSASSTRRVRLSPLFSRSDVHQATEISNPKLVVIVGSCGLISNIIGLFLFHGQADAIITVRLTHLILDHGHSHDHSHSAKSSKPSSIHSDSPQLVAPVASPVAIRQPRPLPHTEHSSSFSSLYGHPAATRASFVQTANNIVQSTSPVTIDRPHKSRSRTSMDPWSLDRAIITHPSYEHDEHETRGAERATSESAEHEQTSLLQHPQVSYSTSSVSTPGSQGPMHGHSHGGSMNMKALLLHVLGDALGNVGVIATGLIIWLTSWEFKYYCDPIISLLITGIIFHSALPLGASLSLIAECSLDMICSVRSTSFILLQGVPSEVSLEDVRSAILDVEGVLSVHELHIWQLSETKIIASVHVTASRKVDFMPVASKIREILHQRGIHSSTIQPEYPPIRDAIPEESMKVCLPMKN